MTFVLKDGSSGTYVAVMQCGPTQLAINAVAAHHATTTDTPTTSTTTRRTSSSPSTTSPSGDGDDSVTPPGPTPPTGTKGLTSTISPTPVPPEPNNNGKIIGGAVGGVLGALLLIGIAGFVVYRVRVKRREAEFAENTPEMTGVQYFAK